jgi:hypothetical protein
MSLRQKSDSLSPPTSGGAAGMYTTERKGFRVGCASAEIEKTLKHQPLR